MIRNPKSLMLFYMGVITDSCPNPVAGLANHCLVK